MTRWAIPQDDVLRDPAYRRIFTSILIGSLGAQVSMLALPLTAALLLHATPWQMGLLQAAEVLPFALLSLPAGVWLDRVRKLPVYITGELLISAALASVAIAWWLGWLGMTWMFAVAFILGAVHTVAGSAAQIVLTQVVSRDKLVQAHARNGLAGSLAEVGGPGVAGALIQLLGPARALLVDAGMLLASVLVLRKLDVQEDLQRSGPSDFRAELRAGLGFVRRHRLLIALAACVGGWQACHNAAHTVAILHATRNLGLSERAIGLSYIASGLGAFIAATRGDVWSRRFGPGPTLMAGFALTAIGWALPAVVPGSGPAAVAAFAGMLMLFGLGATLVFINFLAVRQAVTPAPLLGRMTSTMRWLILLPAMPGALVGGWIGQHVDLRATLGLAAVGALALVLAMLRRPGIRDLKALPLAPATPVPPAPPAPPSEGPPAATSAV